MFSKKNRVRRITLITLSILFSIFLLLVIFLSPIVKYLIEKYDEPYTGRKITLDWAYVNPITGFVYLNDLKCFEQNKDSIFFSSEGISVKLNMRKLFQKEYEISYLNLDKPKGYIVQHTKEKFNFSDLLEKFTQKDTSLKAPKDTARIKFSLLDVKIIDGTFYLTEDLTPVHYFVKHVNLSSSGLRWNADTIANKFSLESGIGAGTIEGQATLNMKTKDYRSHVIVRRLDLKIIEQYVKDLASFGTFTAMINADITAKGNLKDGRNVDAVGGIGIYNFHFGKSKTEDFASFDKFVIKINHLNPSRRIYMIDSISLVHPFFKYQKYDHLDNIQMMFGKKGENVKEVAQSEKFNLVIEIARYIKLLSKNFLHSDYKINRVGIYRANLVYEDYSINEKFRAALDPLTLIGDSMSSRNKRVQLRLISGIKPYGNMNLRLSINPQDSSDFELDYDMNKINVSLLNPYLTTLTSFPLDRGSVRVKGNWRVRDGEINSDNHLLVIDPRIAERVRANHNKWLPMKVVMFFVRESGNAIDYEVPISGNLKDPKFHVKDVILDVLTNIFVKPATTSYRYEVKTVENEIEKTIGFNWQIGSTELLDNQLKFAEKVADFLKDNKTSSINVFPVHYTEKEKEFIGFFEAKKKYFFFKNKKHEMSKDDSIAVNKMSVKDSAFVEHMRSELKDEMMFTVQQLCAAYVGPEKITAKYKQLLQVRKDKFMAYFSEKGVQDRVHLKKNESQVPFNGFSYYRIAYNGEIPESMKEAFDELKQYDSENPRKKLEKERQNNRKFFNARQK